MAKYKINRNSKAFIYFNIVFTENATGGGGGGEQNRSFSAPSSSIDGRTVTISFDDPQIISILKTHFISDNATSASIFFL